MLLERSSYADDFPISIRILNVTEYPIHYHQDIEFIFLLKGELELKNGSHRYHLTAGDVFTNNGREIHSMYGVGQENMVAVIQISNLFFTYHFPELSKSCYRTYSADGQDKRLDHVQELLLLILLSYLKRDSDYKQQCIEQVSSLIRYLNLNYNLFSFNSQRVVSFQADNPVMAVRLSRIINYLYENHEQKLTLQELADREHLSVFYLSHMIKDCTGMNFREFLCFARVEWSELSLLGTNKKISTIAKEVGFSTTAYYEEHFKKWFQCAPEEHRNAHLPLVKGASRPERTATVPSLQATTETRRMLSSICTPKNAALAFHQTKLMLLLQADASLLEVHPIPPRVTVCPQDAHVLGTHGLLALLESIACKDVCIETTVPPELGDDSVTALEKLLSCSGYSVTQVSVQRLPWYSYGFDSVAALHLLLKDASENHITSKPRSFRLRDSNDFETNFKGDSAVFSAGGIPKPVWWGYTFLSHLSGTLLSRGPNHIIVRHKSNIPTFTVLLFRCSGDVLSLCSRATSLAETLDVIAHDQDELAVSLTLDHLVGNFTIAKSTVNNHNSMLGFMEKLGFPERMGDSLHPSASWYVTPKIEVFTQRAMGQLILNFLISGAEVQQIIIQRQEET